MCTSIRRIHTCVCVFVRGLGHDINLSSLPARVQKFESHNLRELFLAWIPKAWHIVGSERLFGEWKDGSSKQVPCSHLRKTFSDTQV